MVAPLWGKIFLDRSRGCSWHYSCRECRRRRGLPESAGWTNNHGFTAPRYRNTNRATNYHRDHPSHHNWTSSDHKWETWNFFVWLACLSRRLDHVKWLIFSQFLRIPLEVQSHVTLTTHWHDAVGPMQGTRVLLYLALHRWSTEFLTDRLLAWTSSQHSQMTGCRPGLRLPRLRALRKWELFRYAWS